MSRENVEVVERAFEAFDRGDFDAVLALCDEDIVISQPRELPGAPPILHGHAGVLESFELWPEQWDDFRLEILDMRDLGSHVLVSARTFGRGKQSGIEVEARFTFVFTLRNGKLSEWQLFLREEEALEAVGLRK
jgi:ketosteroid isomerase-like protein